MFPCLVHCRLNGGHPRCAALCVCVVVDGLRAWDEVLNRNNNCGLAPEAASKTVAGFERDGDPGWPWTGLVFEHEVEKDILRAESLQMDVVGPVESKSHQRVACEPRRAALDITLDSKDVDVQFDARLLAGPLTRVKTHGLNLGIVEGRPAAEAVLQRRRRRNQRHSDMMPAPCREQAQLVSLRCLAASS